MVSSEIIDVIHKKRIRVSVRVSKKWYRSNGIALNGIALNGITLNGIALNVIALNGITLNGITLNGIAQIVSL